MEGELCRGEVPRDGSTVSAVSPDPQPSPGLNCGCAHVCVCVYLSVHMRTHTHIIMTFGVTALLYLNATKSASFNTLFY